MHRVILFLLFFSVLIFSEEQANILVSGDTQVDAEIEEYEYLAPGDPIQVILMITHDAKDKIDVESIRLGTKPLMVTFVKSVPMSYGALLVTSYRFELPAMGKGMHILEPVKVKVGGQEYQTAPMTVRIGY